MYDLYARTAPAAAGLLASVLLPLVLKSAAFDAEGE